MWKRVGFDVGNVIIDVNRWKATKTFASTPPVPGAFGGMGRIIRVIQPPSAFIISKVKDDIETREWLVAHQFYGATGFNQRNLRFCRKHHQKAGIARGLGLTHFVDDRLEVLCPMIGIVPFLYLFGAHEAPEGITPVPSWGDVVREVL